MIYIILLILIAGISRAIHEHGKWRNSEEWSILYGTWWLKHDHKYNLDGYHTTGRILITACSAIGFLLCYYEYHVLSILIVIELVYFVYLIFYHIVFTPKGKRDFRYF
jgi:uncharacterized membrane protein